jgi:hypothetical protein
MTLNEIKVGDTVWWGTRESIVKSIMPDGSVLITFPLPSLKAQGVANVQPRFLHRTNPKEPLII